MLYLYLLKFCQESREISLSQAQAFSRPLVLKCKEVGILSLLLGKQSLVLLISYSYAGLQSIRKYHRAINEARARKRKVM